MSLTTALRTAVRNSSRARIQSRPYSTTGEDYLSKQAAVKAHALETTDLWRKISYFICVPGIIVCTAWVYNVESDHHHHQEHEKAENDGVLPQPPQYEYLNKRSKPFPWGNNALFFNSGVNKNMEEE